MFNTSLGFFRGVRIFLIAVPRVFRLHGESHYVHTIIAEVRMFIIYYPTNPRMNETNRTRG